MALTISDILNRRRFPGLRLASGIRGIENRVTWVNIMEILVSPDTIKPGELLITTGYGLADRGKYGDLIARLKSRGISGIAIQTGYYIDQIPDFILEDANCHALPILNLPPDYSFSDILRTLIGEIGAEPELLTPSGFDAGYFQQTLSEQFTEEEAHAGDADRPALFGSGSCLLCLRAVNANAVQAEAVDTALRRIGSALSSRSARCLSAFRSGGQGCFLLRLKEGVSFAALSHDIQIQLTLISEQSGINFYLGADAVPSADALSRAFRNSAHCLALLRKIEARRGVCTNESYSFIESLGTLYLAGRTVFVQSKPLQLLLEKDRSKGSEYVLTLRIYLSENCNTTRTAERLFIHRHTLLNRLKTIRELCGVDLQSYYSRTALSCALMLHDFYGV